MTHIFGLYLQTLYDNETHFKFPTFACCYTGDIAAKRINGCLHILGIQKSLL